MSGWVELWVIFCFGVFVLYWLRIVCFWVKVVVVCCFVCFGFGVCFLFVSSV